MRKFKKSLAFALAAAMAITAVPVNAAAAPTAKLGTSTLYANGISKYKTTYVSVTKGYTFKHSTKNTKVLTLGKTSGVQAKAAGKTRTGTAKAVVTVRIYKNKKLAATRNLNVTVKPAAYAVSVKVDNTTISLGETAQATGTMATKKASGSLRYYSSNTSVATVNAKTGKITAVAGGTTKITAVSTISRKTSSAVEVTVLADSPVAAQSGAKSIKITNGVSMADRTVTLKRSGSNVTIADKGIETSTDGKEIIITTTNKLTTGAYTVTVGDKEITVNAESEKVSKIELLSDKAAIDASNDKKAYVYYVVTNQFGEDITKTTTVKVSGTDISGTQDKNNGEIVFDRASGASYIINRDVVSVVAMYPDTGISTQAVLTISDKAAIKELTFEGIYNPDGKELTQDSDSSISDYYLLFTAKDQYGSNFKKYDNVIVGEDLYVTVGGGITYLQTELDSNSRQTAKKITKDGKEYLGVRMKVIQNQHLGAGTATLSVVSTLGASINDTFTVESGSIAESITINPPADLVAGEKYTIDYTALDAKGNIVTGYDSVKDITINGAKAPVSVANLGTFNWKKATNGNGVLELNTTGISVSNNQQIMVSFMTRTYKQSTATFNIKKNAELKAVTLKDDIGIYASVAKNIKVSDLKVEDQHGRSITNAEEVAKLLRGNQVGYQLKGTATGGITGTAGTAIGNMTAVTVPANATGDTVLFTFTSSITDDGTISLAAFDSANTMLGSESSKTIVSATQDDLSSPRATIDGKVFAAGTAHAQKIKVIGRRLGVDIEAPVSAYSVTTGGTDLTTSAADNTVFVTAGSKVADLTSNNDTTQTVNVQFGDKDLSCSVTLTKVAPAISNVTFKNDTIDVASGDTINVAYIANSVIDKVKDSYGVEYIIPAGGPLTVEMGRYESSPVTITPLITFKSIVSAGTLTDNGKISGSLVAGGTGFSAQLELNYNGQKFDVELY